MLGLAAVDLEEDVPHLQPGKAGTWEGLQGGLSLNTSARGYAAGVCCKSFVFVASLARGLAQPQPPVVLGGLGVRLGRCRCLCQVFCSHTTLHVKWFRIVGGSPQKL